MDLAVFANSLSGAILGAWREFCNDHPSESPYAFAIIEGQCGNYLGCAFATEEGLMRIAASYDRHGYRYQACEWELFENQEKLRVWLRWANPDDGWYYEDFPERFGIQSYLAALVADGAFGDNAEDLEEFCTQVLASLLENRAWKNQLGGRSVIVGVTSAENPRDFLRTATRANPYPLVRQLWSEHREGEEMSGRIVPP